MKLLLTNDDGIDGEGLHALVNVLAPLHDVYVVAPDKNRSAVSHSFTLRDAVIMSKPVKKDGVTWCSCSGTPADCVHVVVAGLLGFLPDIVLSGINKGYNLGTDLVYSGTAAGARHASMEDIPGIAVSLGSPSQTWNFKPLAEFVRDNLDTLVSMCSRNIYVNVNACDFDAYKGWRLTVPAERRYNDRMEFYKAPDGRIFAFKIFGEVDSVKAEDSDLDAVKSGYVSISKVHSQPQPFLDGDLR
ncbi:MAG: 5'/3'-nucleotidase SurE [Treponemataceae bacterium]|nr:5'/3'-nucleotidase SurE [Treponemataceae bacterium]